MNEKPKDLDSKYTDEIVCPHCGYEHGDSWETIDENTGDGDKIVFQCSECEKSFTVQFNFEYSYSSFLPTDTTITHPDQQQEEQP